RLLHLVELERLDNRLDLFHLERLPGTSKLDAIAPVTSLAIVPPPQTRSRAAARLITRAALRNSASLKAGSMPVCWELRNSRVIKSLTPAAKTGLQSRPTQLRSF